MKSSSNDAMGDISTQSPETPEEKKGLRTWLKRIGVAGFLFFLLKGLAWVFVFWGGGKMLGCD